MTKFFICGGLAAVLLAPSLGRALRAEEGNAKTLALCQLISSPDKYLEITVTLRVKVNIYRHGTTISDRACPKESLLLTAEQAASETEALSHFYRYLAEHRRSSKPILATVTGRLVKGKDSGFELKRDVVFQMESASEISEGSQQNDSNAREQ